MGVKEKTQTTTYVVLVRRMDSERGWTVIRVQEATSADVAVRVAAGGDGIYVAVPARSWKPMRVEQVQTVQTVITAADEPDPAKASNSKHASESEIRAVEAEAEA